MSVAKTLLNLFDEHEKVVIPMIQRDYAQGRASEENIRQEFLAVLREVFENGDSLNLDFVYGTVERFENDQTRFLPLDGQQRLTTLFLLHWYLAWVDGKFEDFRDSFSSGSKSRFSYRVRPTSEDFFDSLVDYQPEAEPQEIGSLETEIRNQSWYFRHWRLDPTIQSCLCMLQAIHERFADCSGGYEQLVSPDTPAITFHLQNLDDFGLSEDLYVKMNARGKPLTEFETFKARYEKVLENDFGDEAVRFVDKDRSVAEHFSNQIDTLWAEFFWKFCGNEVFDIPLMRLIRVIALITRDPDSDSFSGDVQYAKFVGSDFSSLNRKGWLDRKCSEAIISLFDRWSSETGEMVRYLPSERYFNELTEVQGILNDSHNLDYSDLVRFLGYALFHLTHENPDAAEFEDWMRVIYNLSENSRLERVREIQYAFATLYDLAGKSSEIQKAIAEPETTIKGFDRYAQEEERLKARLMLADNRWRELLLEAEGHPYFRGQVGFLLYFCDLWETTAEEVNALTESQHEVFQDKFREYYEKASLMLGANGMDDDEEEWWRRALLASGKFLTKRGSNNSLGSNPPSDKVSWKALLRQHGEKADCVKELFDKMALPIQVPQDLKNIVSESDVSEVWLRELIKTPQAIRYCGKSFIRWKYDWDTNEEKFYLLSKIRTSSMHAELFTYCLYLNEIIPWSEEGLLDPFELQEYYFVPGENEEPQIYFIWDIGDEGLEICVIDSQGDFEVQVYGKIDDSLKADLQKAFGFEEFSDGLTGIVPREEIKTELVELAEFAKKLLPG